ncbi:MAG: tetratricopeptide repeat-containing sensor histidine kinase [Flammeovirgaceae bacterium]
MKLGFKRIFYSTLLNYYRRVCHIPTLFTLLFSLLVTPHALSNPTLDSLFQKLSASEGDLEKANVLISIAQYYRFNHPDSSANYAEQALLLAESIHYEEGRMQALNYWALAEQAEGDYSDAIKNHFEALKIAENMGNEQYANLTKIYLGSANYMNKDLEQAEKFYQEAKKYFSAANTPKDKRYLASVLNNLGMLSKEAQDIDKAIEYYKASMEIKEELGQKRGIANTLHNIGALYIETQKYELALVYLQRSLSLKKEIADKVDIASTYIQIAQTYLLLHQPNRALSFTETALQLATSSGEKDELKETYHMFSKIYAYNKQFDKAYEYFNRYHNMYDSLFKTENLRHIAELQAIYGIREKHIQNMALLHEKSAQEKINSRLRITNFAVITALGVTLVLALALFRNNRLKRRAYQLLEIKKKKLDVRTQELTKANDEMQRLTEELSVLLEKTRFQTQILKQHQEEIRSQNEELLTQQEDLNHKNFELQDAIDQLKHAQSQLVQSEKMASLGQLTAGIAHEINNPINYINSGIIGLKSVIHDLIQVMEGYDQLNLANYEENFPKIQQLKEELEFHELIDGLNTLTHNISLGAQRTADIVKGLRRFSHRDGREPKQTDLHENLDSTLMLLHNQYKERIVIERNYGDIPKVECFGGKMNQVFMNVLSNAIQSIDGKGTVSVTTSFVADFQKIEKHFSIDNSISEPVVLIEISDTGRGMPNGIQNKIYDPFFTTKEVGQGTGLGLSISLNIVKQHRGFIDFESQEKAGTTFTICLPIKQPKNLVAQVEV